VFPPCGAAVPAAPCRRDACTTSSPRARRGSPEPAATPDRSVSPPQPRLNPEPQILLASCLIAQKKKSTKDLVGRCICLVIVPIHSGLAGPAPLSDFSTNVPRAAPASLVGLINHGQSLRCRKTAWRTFIPCLRASIRCRTVSRLCCSICRPPFLRGGQPPFPGPLHDHRMGWPHVARCLGSHDRRIRRSCRFWVGLHSVVAF